MGQLRKHGAGGNSSSAGRTRVVGRKEEKASRLTAGSGPTLRLFIFITTITFLCLWLGHFHYLQHLFENQRFFSHLSDLEREMTYRTEMGLYYSYYKTLITAPTFATGLHSLIHDNVTEFGHTINTLQRFNLYPEVVLGASFRTFKAGAQLLSWEVESCWRVNRGEGMPPIESCVGTGNPHYFYTNGVFAIAALTLPTTFLFGILMSSSYIGGLLSAAAFLFNHGEATRVMWTPPLRESFAYPILLIQILAISYAMKAKKCTPLLFAAIVSLTTGHLLSWQFSNFVLAVEIGSILAVYAFDLIEYTLTRKLLNAFTVTWALGFIFLFGNFMLIASLFCTSLLSLYTLLALAPLLYRITFRPLYVLLNFALFTLGTLGFKLIITRTFNAHDDGHVVELMRAKFSAFTNFHTQLYLCAPEFDFIDHSTISNLMATWLLPTFGAVLLLILLLITRAETSIFWRNTPNKKGETISPELNRITVKLIFNAILAMCFAIMATIFMRLKLFATPHLCIMASSLANKEILHRLFGERLARYRALPLCALLAVMAYHGSQNIRQQLAMRGEYNNPEQERLFDWILRETPKEAVFAGSMSLMANVKLSTLRPIINHPHYENEEIRNRTLAVYSIYSRKPPEEVYGILKRLGIDYYVLQVSSCISSHPKPNCTYAYMWDLVDPANVGRETACSLILNTLMKKGGSSALGPMHIAHNTGDYIVLRL